MLNCGYGSGHSVLQVLAAVKRLAGVELNVKMGPRRAGDPAMLVARADRIRRDLAWQPQYDDLETIVRHSLEWERKLPKRPHGRVVLGRLPAPSCRAKSAGRGFSVCALQ